MQKIAKKIMQKIMQKIMHKSYAQQLCTRLYAGEVSKIKKRKRKWEGIRNGKHKNVTTCHDMTDMTWHAVTFCTKNKAEQVNH